jgi:DNA-binding transcriptional regulator YhcF (GntR family)
VNERWPFVPPSGTLRASIFCHLIGAVARLWSFSEQCLYAEIETIMLQLDGPGPPYQQVCRGFRNEILSRPLAPGERVVSTRALADPLKPSRNTEVSAHEQLHAEGYLEAGVGAAGTIVAPLPTTGRSLHCHYSELSHPQQHAFTRSVARLAIMGQMVLGATSTVTKSLGLPALVWELAPPCIRYHFRPGGAAFGGA